MAVFCCFKCLTIVAANLLFVSSEPLNQNLNQIVHTEDFQCDTTRFTFKIKAPTAYSEYKALLLFMTTSSFLL